LCTTCAATTGTALHARAGLLQLHDAPRAYDLTTDATPTPSHPAPARPVYDLQQALPFLDARAAVVDPTGAAMIFNEGTPFSVLDARLREPQLGCRTPLSWVVPSVSIAIPYAAFLASRPRWSLGHCTTLPLDAGPSRASPTTMHTTTATSFCARYSASTPYHADTLDTTPARSLAPTHTTSRTAA
jgi:hypothetical protein